jgi:hypothetical protein
MPIPIKNPEREQALLEAVETIRAAAVFADADRVAGMLDASNIINFMTERCTSWSTHSNT